MNQDNHVTKNNKNTLAFLAISALVCMLSACGTTPEQIKQKVEMRAEAECATKQKGQMAKRHRCIRDIVISEAPNDPSLPIFLKHNETAIQLAELYDKGKISKTRYDELVGDSRAKFQSDMAIYNNQLRQESNLRMQAVTQQLQQQQMINNMNRPTTTSCNRFGNTVNCNTW
jgi:predicted component of type VI protein secretion system